MDERHHNADRARTRHDEWLLRRMAEGDDRARDELAERFLPLAHTLARRYSHSAETYDDVFQVACVGMLKAIDGFDVGRGNAFSSYAVPTIVGELKRYFRDRTWMVRPPRDLLERALRVERAVEVLREELCRGPTVGEIADHLGLTLEDALEGIEAGRAQRATSFDAAGDGGDEPQSPSHWMGVPDSGYADAERRILISQLGRGLRPDELELLHLRFVEDLTQSEIGKLLGVSQMQVSRLVRRALERLREVAQHDDRWPAEPGRNGYSRA